MKRFCLLLVAAGMLSLAPLARAQHAFGIVGGLNLANLSVDPNDGIDYSNLTALGIGGMVELQLANNTSLRLAPMYLQKGAEAQFGGDTAKLKLAYLEVPALLKYSFGNASTRPYLLAGPSLGFLLNAKVTACKTFSLALHSPPGYSPLLHA